MSSLEVGDERDDLRDEQPTLANWDREFDDHDDLALHATPESKPSAPSETSNDAAAGGSNYLDEMLERLERMSQLTDSSSPGGMAAEAADRGTTRKATFASRTDVDRQPSGAEDQDKRAAAPEATATASRDNSASSKAANDVADPQGDSISAGSTSAPTAQLAPADAFRALRQAARPQIDSTSTEPQQSPNGLILSFLFALTACLVAGILALLSQTVVSLTFIMSVVASLAAVASAAWFFRLCRDWRLDGRPST